MAKRIDVFYAYPSNPLSVGECIGSAVDMLKTNLEIRNKGIRFKLWPEMQIGGKSLIRSITDNIGRTDIFACDLTSANFNVTFELGYAIGKSKRVWISLNEGVETAPRDFQRVYTSLLGGLGYRPYTNYENLAHSFEMDRPWSDLKETPIGSFFRRRIARPESQFFPREVVGVPTSEFITRTILPRPRDIIHLVRSAINLAVNRGDSTVTADDFLQARERYSDFVLKSVLAEDDPRRGKLEKVLFEFAGAPKTTNVEDITSRLLRAGVEDSDHEFYINLLCDINFLGIKTNEGYRYPKDENERRNLREVVRRLPSGDCSEPGTYQVNAAFHQVLQID